MPRTGWLALLACQAAGVRLAWPAAQRAARPMMQDAMTLDGLMHVLTDGVADRRGDAHAGARSQQPNADW